ncbi:MAG: sigma-70 family RNA polymerase sigma factor [Armatimonadetes bacterium]|nr:sigma-70 family RNA polymerase sigma factor [Armatimonadota bacterium]
MGGTDLELLARYVKLRDAGAFAELTSRHRDLVYGTCYRLLGDRADAEDVAQECFLHLARSGGRIKASVAGWLHRVAVRTSLAARDRDRARERAEREAGSMRPDRAAEPTWEEIKADVDRAIDRLPEDLREPLVLHFLQAKPQTAVAEELGLSQPAVSRRVGRAIERLRKHLGALGFGVSAAALVAFLEANTAEAAPATLVANLGRMALVGVPPTPTVGLPPSLLGPAASMGAGSKVLCVVAVALTVGAVVQQVAQVGPAAQRRSVIQSATAALTPPPATSPLGRGPADSRDQSPATGPAQAGASKRPSAGLEPGGSNREARSSAPEPAEPAGRAGPRGRATPVAPPEEVVAPRVAQATGLVRDWLPLGQPDLPPNGVNVAPLPAGVDPRLAQQIADVVVVAKQTLEGMGFSRRAAPVMHRRALVPPAAQIQLVIVQGRAYHENVTTDRDATIYVRVGAQGIGDEMRGDAGPVAVLCEAVAELYNVWRLPGLNRYLAHAHLVPAVAAELGPDILPAKHPTPLGPDGPEMLEAVTQDEYTCVHPDLAAVAAIRKVEAKLGLEGLLDLVKALPAEAEDPFAAFREAVVKADPELAPAFDAWDQANALAPDAEENYLVASFEPGETVQHIASLHPLRSVAESLWFDTTPETRWSFSNDWSSDGQQSLKLEADETAGWVAFYLRDPDWQFRDLRRFGTFELDLALDAPRPQRVSIRLNDHVSDGHGELRVLDDVLMPGEVRHVAFELSEENLQGYQDVDATYFSGWFRADSVARLYIGLGKPQQRVTLYLDRICFTPRLQPTAGGGGRVGGPAGRMAGFATRTTPMPAEPTERLVIADAPRVRTRSGPGVDPGLVSNMADMVAAAQTAMEAMFPGRRVETIDLVVGRARMEGHESVVTDRSHTLYVRTDEFGIGELFRPDAGPLAILCEAVAELHNPGQLPGLNRFVAHRYLVPAVAEEMPPFLLLDHRRPPILAPDGPEMLWAMADPQYSDVHPDFAAVAALCAIEEQLGPEGLFALIDEIPADSADPFGALRAAATARAPQLAEAFAAYDEATGLEADEAGSCLIASFEEDETIRKAQPLRTATETLRFILSPQNRWSLSNEWSTDGARSFKVEADETAPWMSVVIDDADWKYKDWRRFSELSFDFLVESPEPQWVFFCAQDHPTCGHGCVVLFQGTVKPGEPQHVSFLLNEESSRGQRDMDATYFGGAFRADSVSRIYIGLNKPAQPITLYLDNLRLKVRGALE